MEENPRSATFRSTFGGLIHLQARLASPITWMGPMWAMLCGAVASGGFGWQGQDLMRLALLVLLVDGGWGTLWVALGSTDWATPLRQWRDWYVGQPISPLPYTLPDSPGDWASRWLGQLRAWWREVFWPACGPALSAVAIALPVTAVLGALLGPELLLLSLTALAVVQLGIAWEGCDAIIAVTLPWLAGQVAFGALSPVSAGLALAFTLAWGTARRVESSWACALGLVAQFLAIALLVALHHPLAAAGLALLLTPQLALLPWLRRGQSASWYVRHTRPWLMAAMLVAAWAL